jgi:hypothetical protein
MKDNFGKILFFLWILGWIPPVVIAIILMNPFIIILDMFFFVFMSIILIVFMIYYETYPEDKPVNYGVETLTLREIRAKKLRKINKWRNLFAIKIK